MESNNFKQSRGAEARSALAVVKVKSKAFENWHNSHSNVMMSPSRIVRRSLDHKSDKKLHFEEEAMPSLRLF
jgi:hypothetical protein